MKKILGIIVLGLLWCNTSFAEQIIIECLGTHVYEDDKKSSNNYKRTIQVDFEERGTRDYGLEGFTGDFSNIFITDDYFYNYSLVEFLAPQFTAQVQSISRFNGDMAVTTTHINEETYKEIKIKLDEVNSKIKNYEKQLSYKKKYEVYRPSKQGSNQQEIKKYNIIKLYAEGKMGKEGIIKETAIYKFECKKATKAF